MKYKLDNGRCSLFNGVRKNVFMDASIHRILHLIKTEHFKTDVLMLRRCKDDKQRFELKSNLWSFTPAGCFYDYRNHERINSLSGLVVLDFDNLRDLQISKEKIIDEPCTLACFVSPSGNGLKVLVKTNAKSSSDYAISYNVTAGVYSRIIKKGLDRANDITRLCFLSSDPELYWNPKALIIEEYVNFF